jgi:hypothetical protein
MLPFYRRAMSDLPLDKENQRRNVSRTPGLPSSKKALPDQGRTTPVASTSTSTTTNTANDAAHFAAMRSPPGSSKVLRKRWEMQFEKEEAEQRLQAQQQPRLMEKGAVRLAASSPVPVTILTSSMDDVVMRNSNNSSNSNSSNSSPIPGADLHDPDADADADADLVNTTCDSDQSLGFLVEPVSARKDCTNPVAMTLLHSDDGMEDVTFLLEHDCSTSTTVSPSKGGSSSTGSRQSPLTCSARVPVQNIARPVAARPTVQQEPHKQQFYQDDHHHHHQQQQQQQQYYYHQQQEHQQQQQYYQQQQQQQRPYSSHFTHHQF